MKVDTFEDIVAWQKAKELTKAIYKHFGNNPDYAFKNQIQRASVSIMNNIAEGYERQSNKEFRQFLFIAKGSCGEVRSMVHLSKELAYTTPSQSELLLSQATETSKILSGFIKKL